MPFYGVAHGFIRGVYDNFGDVQKQINGFPQPVQKKFESRDAAEEFVAAATPSRKEFCNPEEGVTTWYSVARGKVVGVFSSFDDVKKHIDGYVQPLYKKFDSYEQAKAHFDKFYEGKFDASADVNGEDKISKIEEQGNAASPEKRKTRGDANAEKATTYYAVARGNKTGVFTSWDECKTATAGFKGAKFKKFDNEKDAQLFADGKTLKNIQDAKRKAESSDDDVATKKTKKA